MSDPNSLWRSMLSWRHARRLLPASTLAAAIAGIIGICRVRLEQPHVDLDRVDSLGRVALIDTPFSSRGGVVALAVATGAVVAVLRLLVVRPALQVARQAGRPGPAGPSGPVAPGQLMAVIAPVAAAGALTQIGRAAFVIPGIVVAMLLGQVRFRAASTSDSVAGHFRWSATFAVGNPLPTVGLTVLNLTPAAIAALFAGYSEVIVFSVLFVVVEPIAAVYGASQFHRATRQP